MLWRWITGIHGSYCLCLGPGPRYAGYLVGGIPEPESPGGAAGLVAGLVSLDS